MPDHKKIRDNRYLKVFGKYLHNPALWHLNRRSVARAFGIGLFFAWVPVPFQMVLAAGGAIALRANIAVSVALVWLTNPFTMPPLFYAAYKVGSFILGEPVQHFEMEPTLEWLQYEMLRIWQPFLLGCFVAGVVSSIAGFVGIQLAWRHAVLKRLRRRNAVRPS